MTNKEIKTALENAIARKEQAYQDYRSNRHIAAVKEMMIHLHAEIISFRTVLDNLDGDRYASAARLVTVEDVEEATSVILVPGEGFIIQDF